MKLGLSLKLSDLRGRERRHGGNRFPRLSVPWCCGAFRSRGRQFLHHNKAATVKSESCPLTIHKCEHARTHTRALYWPQIEHSEINAYPFWGHLGALAVFIYPARMEMCQRADFPVDTCPAQKHEVWGFFFFF